MEGYLLYPSIFLHNITALQFTSENHVIITLFTNNSLQLRGIIHVDTIDSLVSQTTNAIAIPIVFSGAIQRHVNFVSLSQSDQYFCTQERNRAIRECKACREMHEITLRVREIRAFAIPIWWATVVIKC